MIFTKCHLKMTEGICWPQLKRATFLIFALVFFQWFTFAQSTFDVVIGTNNVPITEFKFTLNGSTITQTSGVTSTSTTTSLPIDLEHVVCQQRRE